MRPCHQSQSLTRYLHRHLHRYLYLLLLFGLISGCHNGQPATDQSAIAGQLSGHDPNNAVYTSDSQRLLTIVNWNIEWLGSKSNGPKNKSRQLASAIKILKYLHADLYCLCEIVDPASLEKLTRALGPDYQYKLSRYASGANDPSDPGYAKAQKLAYIYNSRIFTDVQTSPLLKSDPRAGYYFAGGRYPFLLKTDIEINQTKARLVAVLLHAKAGADRSSYQRRLAAAKHLKKELDETYGESPVIILGDFNDEVDGSITPGQSSPYATFSKDLNYHVLTWQETKQGKRSTLDYTNVIDQQIISAQLNKYYVPNSTRIRTDVKSVVKDYARGVVSDHYPVSSQFLITRLSVAKPPLKSSTAIENKTETQTQAQTQTQTQTQAQSRSTEASAQVKTKVPENMHSKGIQLFQAKVASKNIQLTPKRKADNIQFILCNSRDHKVLSVHRKYINAGDTFALRTPKLYAGHYELVIFCQQGKQVIAFDKK